MESGSKITNLTVLDRSNLSKKIAKIDLSLDAYTQDLLEANQKMSTELYEAAKMLEDLMPSDQYLEQLESKYGIECSSFYRPLSILGGDFFNIIQPADNLIACIIWDFTGHGVTAAINSFRLHSILKGNQKNSDNPGEFLTKINTILYSLLPRSKFATMFYGVFDTNKKTLKYSCASCPAPVLLSFAKNEFKILDGTGFPLGVQDKSKYKTQEIDLSDWDFLILYSDALIETENKEQKFLQINEIAEVIISEYCERKPTAEDIKNFILKKFNQDCEGRLNDDLSIQVIKFGTVSDKLI